MFLVRVWYRLLAQFIIFPRYLEYLSNCRAVLLDFQPGYLSPLLRMVSKLGVGDSDEHAVLHFL